MIITLNEQTIQKKMFAVLPSRELTYPPKMAFLRWFSFSQGGICIHSLEGMLWICNKLIFSYIFSNPPWPSLSAGCPLPLGIPNGVVHKPLPRTLKPSGISSQSPATQGSIFGGFVGKNVGATSGRRVHDEKNICLKLFFFWLPKNLMRIKLA